LVAETTIPIDKISHFIGSLPGVVKLGAGKTL